MLPMQKNGSHYDKDVCPLSGQTSLMAHVLVSHELCIVNAIAAHIHYFAFIAAVTHMAELDITLQPCGLRAVLAGAKPEESEEYGQ